MTADTANGHAHSSHWARREGSNANILLQVEAAIKQFDADGNGTIEFGEFLKMVVCKPWYIAALCSLRYATAAQPLCCQLIISRRSTILPLARPAGSFATCARELFSEVSAGWLTGWLTEWLSGWLCVWLAVCLAGCVSMYMYIGLLYASACECSLYVSCMF